MTTVPAERRPAIQLYGQSLEPQARLKHRLWIGVRVEALLDGYWQTRPSDAVKDEVLADWIDGLEAFTGEEIRAACRDWLNTAPRVKPKVGDIRGLILAERAKIVAAMPKREEPPRQEPTPEEKARAAELVRQAGFALKRGMA